MIRKIINKKEVFSIKETAELLRGRYYTTETDGLISVFDSPKPENFKQETLCRLRDIASEAFGKEVSFDSLINHAFGCRYLHLFSHGTDLAGFASFTDYDFNSNRIIYLGGTVVRPVHQKRRFLSESLKIILKETVPRYLTMRTQNPVIYHAVSKLRCTMQPSFDESDTEMVDVGQFIARLLGMQNYDPKVFCERGTYNGSLYISKPTVNDQRITNLFEHKLKLNYLQGDSIIIVARVRDEVAEEVVNLLR